MRTIFLIPILFCIYAISHAQTWETLTTENSGLADNDVRAVHIDPNGIMWLGTASGLCSFDGENWTVFNTNNSDIISNAVSALMSDQLDTVTTLWIATENGVSKALVESANKISIVTSFQQSNSNLLSNFVTSVGIDPWRISWFGTRAGANSFNGDTLASYSKENWWITSNNIKAIEVAPNGMVYFGTEGTGISRLQTDLNSIDGVTSASNIDTGWSGADEIGGDKLASDSVYSIYIRPDGEQWFGTNRGVSRHTSYDTRRDWTTFTVSDGITNNFVTAIAEDAYGNIWIGTKDGISVYNGRTWASYDESDGLADNVVQSIACDHQGVLWFGTKGGLSRLAGVTLVKSEKEHKTPGKLKIRNHPNPFRQQTAIQFFLHDQHYVNVAVYNVLGQKVKTLFDGTLPEGMNSLLWRGEDSHGILQPRGAYFVRIAYDGKSETRLIYLNR